MSTKGRGRGRKAVAATEVTQENIVDSTSTDKSEVKVQDVAPEITEKDKKASKRRQVATENGTTETSVALPAKRGRGKAKEKESTPVEEEKSAPVEKETKPKRGGKRGAQANDAIVEKMEETTTVESKPSVPAKKGRGKKAVAEPEPETQAEPETQEQIEPKKSAKGKRGAKKEKPEDSTEDGVATNGEDANTEKETAEPVEDEAKDNFLPQAKRGRGRKPAAEKEEKQPVKTAGAKKIIGGERSRRRAADSKDEEEKEEPPVENGEEEEVVAAAKKGGRGRKRAAEPAKKQTSENGTQEEDAEVITGK